MRGWASLEAGDCNGDERLGFGFRVISGNREECFARVIYGDDWRAA